MDERDVRVKTVQIKFTKEQRKQLEPVFNSMVADFIKGEAGSILCQLYHKDSLSCVYVPREIGKKIKELVKELVKDL